jgi:hypothetical protein
MTEIHARASSESRHGTGLCFAARLISVAVSAGMACILASWAASYGVNEGMGGIVPFHFGLSVFHFWLIPAMLTVIAWRYHLSGGVVMLLYSPIPFLITFLITVMSEGHQDASHLVFAAFVLPVGAALHLVAWWRERRSQRASTRTRPSASTCITRDLQAL